MDHSRHSLALNFLHGDKEEAALTPSLHQSLNYRIDNPESFDRVKDSMTANLYARRGNPNNTMLAKLLANAEGAEAGMIFSSGMAATTAVMMSLLKSGDHVVVQGSHYIGTTELSRDLLPGFGVEVSVVDQTSVIAFENEMKENTKLIMLETPVNPLLTITDLDEIARLAKQKAILTFCDNTFATPFNQRPIEHGIDVVMHSISKYIGGHHDLLGGAVVSRKEIIDRVWSHSITTGGVCSPFNSWLALRGLKTLELRVERHNQNAMALAQELEKHPAVDKVSYPGLPSHPQHELARKQMSGFGGLLTFKLKGGLTAGRRFIERLKIPDCASSLGGVTSVVIQPAALFGARLSDDELRKQGLVPGMVRFSTGIEPTGDLLSDVVQALQ